MRRRSVARPETGGLRTPPCHPLSCKKVNLDHHRARRTAQRLQFDYAWLLDDVVSGLRAAGGQPTAARLLCTGRAAADRTAVVHKRNNVAHRETPEEVSAGMP